MGKSKSANIKVRRPGWVIILVVLSLLCAEMKTASAQEDKVDLNALTRETQKTIQKAGRMTIVWWIPEEFWQASFTQNPAITSAQVESFLQVLRPYMLIAVVDGTIGPFGGMQYRPKADIQASIQIRDGQGIRYPPLGEDKVDINTQSFLSMMKPALTNTLGPMGENMHFFLFPAKNKDGQSIAETKREGVFGVELGQREFMWSLPLSSLLPSKICPQCGKKASGTWNFCPWCGVELSK